MSTPIALPTHGPVHVAPRRPWRRYGLAALGVALIAGGALLGAKLYLQGSESVLEVSRSIALGHVFQADDLTVVHVTFKDGTVDRVAADDEGLVIGHTAAVPLLAGELVGRHAVGAAVTVPPGDAVVGIALKRGEFPIGLAVGENIWVVDTAGNATAASQGVSEAVGPIPATVLATEEVADDPDGTTIFSLLLQDTGAATVTQMSAAGQASLALVPPSTP